MINKNKQSNKTLSLAERVQMINEYTSSSPKPSFGALAAKYAVNYSLIRNIILNKELFLSAYAKSNAAKSADAGYKRTYYVKSFKFIDQKQNRLSLLQRMKVINEFKSRVPQPTINVLANKYKVSNRHILNILENQKSILKLFEEAGETCSTVDDNCEREIKQRRHQINFLGKVLYEYIQRTLYHKIKIDNRMLLKKAKEVTQCISIQKFRPTRAWLDDFRNIYGIEDFLTDSSFGETMVGKVSKCLHWNTVDIVEYVIHQKCKKCDMEMANATATANASGGNVCGEKLIQQKADCQSRLQLKQVIPHTLNAAIETCTNAMPVPKDYDEMLTKKKQLNSLSLLERMQIVKEYNSNLPKPIFQASARNNKTKNSTQNQKVQLIKHVNTRSSLASSTKRHQEKSNNKPAILQNHNILSPEQQAEIIREYASHKPNPTLKSLTIKYNVSYNYIRQILFNQMPQGGHQQNTKKILLTDAADDVQWLRQQEFRNDREDDQLKTNDTSKENVLQQDSVQTLSDPLNPRITSVDKASCEEQNDPPPLIWQSLRDIKRVKINGYYPVVSSIEMACDKEIQKLPNDTSKDNFFSKHLVTDALKDPAITDNRDTHSALLCKTKSAIPEPFAFENSLVPNTTDSFENNSFANCNGVTAIDGNTIKNVTSPAMSNEIGVALENVSDDAFADSLTDNESQSSDISFMEHISIKSEITSDAEEFLDEDSSMNPETNEAYSVQLLNALDARIEQDHQMHNVNDPMSFQWFPNSDQIMQKSLEEKIIGHEFLEKTETNAMLEGNTVRIVEEPNEESLLQDVSKDAQQPTLRAIACVEDAVPHLNLLKDFAVLQNNHRAVKLLNLLAGSLYRPEE